MAFNGFSDLLADCVESGIDRSKQLIHETCRRCGHVELADTVYNLLVDKDIAKKVRRRQKKDPKAPKNAKTSYQLFCDAELPKIRNADAEKPMGDVFKELGKRWKGLGEEQKAVYVELAAKDKERYLAEKQQREHELAQSKAGDLTGPGTTVGGNTASTTASDAKGTPDVAGGSGVPPMFSIILGDVARTLHRGYRQMITEACQRCGQPDRAEALCAELLDEKAVSAFPKARRDPNAPKTAKTSYQIFSASKRKTVCKQHPTLSLGEISQKLGELWAKLDDVDKQKWAQRAAADKQRYATEKAAYDKKVVKDATLVPVA